jgi:hypothetical protein
MSVFEADEARNRHPGYVSGRYYAGYTETTATTSALPAIDTIYFHPVLILTPVSFDRVKVNCVTGVATARLKHGLWNMDPTTMKPIGAPIYADNTGLDCGTSSTTPEFTIAVGLAPGMYWWGSKSGHTPTLQSAANSHGVMSWDFGRSSGASTTHMCGLSMAHAMATDMPTLTGAESIIDYATAGVPLPWFRAV